MTNLFIYSRRRSKSFRQTRTIIINNNKVSGSAGFFYSRSKKESLFQYLNSINLSYKI